MSDQGFDFGPPPPKREARQFEPPPWEREQFERHHREQEERERAAQEARDKVLAEQEAARAAEQSATEPETALGGECENAGPPESAKAEVDEKQVALMMLGLRAEEPVVLEGAWLVNLVAGVVVGLVGFASLIWGIAALARKGMPAAGTLGGFVLLAFGVGFLGVGGWLVFKALRQRGVL